MQIASGTDPVGAGLKRQEVPRGTTAIDVTLRRTGEPNILLPVPRHANHKKKWI